jgi:hypothetical protein
MYFMGIMNIKLNLKEPILYRDVKKDLIMLYFQMDKKLLLGYFFIYIYFFILFIVDFPFVEFQDFYMELEFLNIVIRWYFWILKMT